MGGRWTIAIPMLHFGSGELKSWILVMIPACVKIAPPEVLKMIRSSCVGHHVSHCFVDDEVLNALYSCLCL